MKLQHLRTFVVVYQERSFTSAASRVYATQSGLSMQIKELEEHLGVQLFERSTRGVLPTAAGSRYYERALRILRELDDARREIRVLKGELLGSVAIGVMPTISRGRTCAGFERVRDYPPARDLEDHRGIQCRAERWRRGARNSISRSFLRAALILGSNRNMYRATGSYL